MATLTIRNLPDAIRDRLRVRAAEHGRSMEAEARAVLEVGTGMPSGLDEAERKRRLRSAQDALQPYRSPGVSLTDELIADRRLEAWKETVETMHKLRTRDPVDVEAFLERFKLGNNRGS